MISMEGPEFIEHIEDRTNRNFKIHNCPVTVLKEFKEFCDQECGGTYAVGLIQLLKMRKQWEEIVPLLSAIFNDIQQIKTEKEQGKRRLHTFAE